MNDATKTNRSKRREKAKTETSCAYRPINSANDKCPKKNVEWTAEEEKAAFLYTSKVNSARIFAKYLD